MKKIMFIVFAFLSFSISVFADSINNINMDIFINDNGNAHVKETWDVNISGGTEGYKPYYNLGNSEIINFNVRDDRNQVYKNVENWNSNLSFSEKANKSGIKNIKDGIELCFGISKYGNRIYVLEYDITGFVAETSDKQMLFWTLIPHELSMNPKSVNITIRSNKYFTDETPVWGYGNLGGTAYVYNGVIELGSNGKLNSDEYITVLAEFPLGTFSTSNILDENFEHYFEKAETGAVKYKDNYLWKIIAMFLGLIMFLITTIILAYKSKINKNFKKIISKGKFDKDLNYFRDIPCEKDVFYAYFVAASYGLIKNETDFFGTLILNWIKKDIVKIEKIDRKGLFKKREETSLILNSEKIKESTNSKEIEMFNYMYNASENGILEAKEFEKYCTKNYSKILGWFNSVENHEKEKCLNKSLLQKERNKYNETFEIYEEAKKMKGLQKFFRDFSSLKDKSAIEVKLWDYYLMYAQIFGMSEKVASEFKKMYPDVLTDNTYNDVVFVHSFSSRAVNSAATARSRARNYSAGGGGFSSGGGGGGSFGGGGGGGGFR